MVVLDLFCGAGGAARGYADAGFELFGVDIAKQPNYPYLHMQFDVLELMSHIDLSVYDIIHASPPCQGYSKHVSSASSQYSTSRGKDEPRLIAPVREFIQDYPYVIENVVGAREELQSPFLLCGSMFGLPIARHRLFETNFPVTPPPHPKCRGMSKEYALANDIQYREMRVTGKGRTKGTSERWKSFLGVDWYASQRELVEMIPPAYTKFIAESWLSGR